MIGSVKAFSTISGPIPAGSPMVTATMGFISKDGQLSPLTNSEARDYGFFDEKGFSESRNPPD